MERPSLFVLRFSQSYGLQLCIACRRGLSLPPQKSITDLLFVFLGGAMIAKVFVFTITGLCLCPVQLMAQDNL